MGAGLHIAKREGERMSIRVSFIELFEDTVERKTDEIAVVHNEATASFGKLRSMALKIGATLIELTGDLYHRPVAVFMPKCIEAVAANLGIMYANQVFMNLDVNTPSERIHNILELIQPVVIVTDEESRAKLPETEIPVLVVDEVLSHTAEDDSVYMGKIAVDFSRDNLEKRVSYRGGLIDTDPFCIINTSGSTGTPKGVVLNSRSFFDFLDVSTERFGFDGTEVMGSLSPMVFDIYVLELCMLMMYGSRIVLLDAQLGTFPARLLEKLEANCVTFLFWVPSILVNIANMDLLKTFKLPDLKLLWFAGEVFPTKPFCYWYDHLPNVTFANLYGPIEITLDCTYYVVEERPEESEPLPIGKAYHNTDVLILNDKDEMCAVGEEGELCVRGTSLAMGYYNNPEKTAAAFVQNPLNHSYPETIYRTGDVVVMREDGNILFKGRKDSLIKHNGYRIELGEIEHVIENDLKLVKYCCAVYQYEKKAIVLFYENDTEITDKEFRTALMKVFPKYMLPGIYVRKDELPRNTNGKIDRLRLKEEANGSF